MQTSELVRPVDAKRGPLSGHERDLLSPLTPAEADVLFELGERVSYEFGAEILREDVASHDVVLLLEGRCRVVTRLVTDTGAWPRPRETELARLRAGDACAAQESGAATGATVRASGPVLALRFDRRALEELAGRTPSVRQWLTRALREWETSLATRHVPTVAPAGPPSRMPEFGVDAPTHVEAEAFETTLDRSSRRRRIGRFPVIRQIDATDCGCACLAMVFRYFGKRISLKRVRELTRAGAEGTSLAALVSAAQRLGLDARSGRVSADNLDDIAAPAIVHWDNNHWVVFLRAKKNKVRIVDPGAGELWVSRREFLERWNGYVALFDFLDAFEGVEEDRPAGIGWILPYLAPHRGSLVLALLLAGVASLGTMVLPVLTQVVVDRAIVDGATDVLTAVLIAMAVVFVVVCGARALQTYLLAFIAVRVDASVLDHLSRRLLGLPLGYFQARRTGDIQRRIAGARDLRALLVEGAVAGSLALLQLTLAVALMFVYSRVLALAFVCVAPLYVLLMAFSRRVLSPQLAKLEDEYGKYQSDQLDVIKGIETVKAASAEGRFRGRLLHRFLGIAERQFKVDFAILSYQAGLAMNGYLAHGLFLFVGARQAMAGEITLGGFIAFSALVGMANQPLATLLGFWDEYQRASVLLRRLSDVFETELEQPRRGLAPLQRFTGEVRLHNVSFRYGGEESATILRNIDLTIRPNETVALVGRSGSGKTTLARLLAGLYEPTSGDVLFDGIEQRLLDRRDLRDQIGLVLQENQVFATSILENITLSEEGDCDRAIAAAKAAHAHGFISRLPLGYNTIIGETGIRLSGGQLQRIAIARALYKAPSLFIFDEATSALDAESELEIQRNLLTMTAGKTKIIIAHRLSTLRNVDRIIVLDNGEIIEQGTHEDLIQRRGLYFDLASRQVAL